MAISYGGSNAFKNNNINVHTTIYGQAGDSSTRILKQPGLTAEDYARRHYVVSGGFRASYPNSNVIDETGMVGTVWPFNEYKEVESFIITAIEDNSSYHCITPVGPYHIEHEKYNVKAGESFNVYKGNIYLSTADFTVNGYVHTAGAVLGCENGDATITMNADGLLTRFWAVCDL